MAATLPPPPKQEELQPHAVRDQLPSVSYCLTSPPPWPEAVLLGFQHYLVMLGTTVIIPTALVPQMGGGNEEKARVVQTLLFVAGINTLIQSFLGTRLPAVMGASYTFVAPTISIILAGRYNGIADPHEKFVRIMRGTQGALIVASTLQIIMGFSGLWRIVVRLLSPLSAAPLVALVGFGLYELGFPSVAKCVEIGLPQILLLVALSQYVPHLVPLLSTAFERFAVIMSIALIWLYAFFLTVGGAYKNAAPKTQFHCRTDRSGLVGGAPWISVPYPFQWGAPTFDAGEAFAMMAASFVALVESTGAFIAVSRYASATPCPPSVMSRGIGWQGVGILLGGLFGTANGTSVSIENAGLLGLTRVGSRRVVQISAGFMIFFSILGKFGAVFASIPGPIIAAIYCLLFAYVGMAGVGFLQFCNLNSFRTKFILGFSLFMGLSVPQYFNEYTSVAGFGPVHTHARWFNDMINVVFSSKAFVAGAVAYFLDNTLHRRDGTVRKDRGHHFWDRFRSFKTDPRSEEFYSLPFNLNKFKLVDLGANRPNPFRSHAPGRPRLGLGFPAAAASSTPRAKADHRKRGRGDERERVQCVQVACAGGVESPAVHHAGAGPPGDTAPPPPHARGHAPPPLPPHRRAPHHAVTPRDAHPGEAPRRRRDRGDVQRAEAGRGGETRAQTPARRLPPPAAADSEAGSSRRGGCRCHFPVASGHQKPFITVQQHNN